MKNYFFIMKNGIINHFSKLVSENQYKVSKIMRYKTGF